MNLLNYLSKIILILIAVVITVLISLIIPENQFKRYHIELDSTWAKEADRQDYIVDFNNDQTDEIIRHDHINKPGHTLELIYHKQVSVIGIFGEKAFIVSRSLKFADVNQDGIKEMIFIAVSNHSAGLFIMEFDFNKKGKPPVPKFHQIEIDTVYYQNNVPDVINYQILTDKSDIIFDLQSGYSIQPRNLYKYNFHSKKLIRTPRNSIVNKELELLNFQNQPYLLAKKVLVTANTWSQEQATIFKNSKNSDSLKIYDRIKSKIYDVGDFSSYILLYNSKLEFAFNPIEFHGWTNYNLSGFLWIDHNPHIISLTNNQINDSTKRYITLCNLHGDIRTQIHADENFENLFADSSTFVLQCNDKLYVYPSGLKPEKQIDGFSFASGFYDLTSNPVKEFICFEKNKLNVFSENFKWEASFKFAQEFAPYPENNHIEILKKKVKTSILFNSKLFYYLLRYEKNEFAWLQYPFYAGIFLLWVIVLMLLLRINSRRHEREKRHLENIVSERTHELKLKNIELAAQKEEIQSQAEKISEQYIDLEKLDQFKETLTHALVHDLKNPLSQILIHTSNLQVTHSARKMLRLITNMLDVEKYEHAAFVLNKSTCSLHKILEEVKNGQKISLHEKNLSIQLHFIDYLIVADKEIMIRVFDNLLSNAIRYSPLNVNIDLFAEKTGDNFVKIIIRNYGETITEQALPFIFDKYRHFGKSCNGAYRTTGLGLTFCKMAVEAHGGQISVSSKPQEGTDFIFTVPISQKSDEVDETAGVFRDDLPEIRFTKADFEVLKEAVKKVREFEIYEISGFHEALDPLKEMAGEAVKDWISNLFSAIYIQNKDEFDRLIKQAENGQT